MVRRSRAIGAAVGAALLSALIAFFAGWATARAVGVSPIDAFLATVANRDARSATPADLRDQFAVFWQVWDLADSAFYRVEALDQQRMVYGAIQGMLASLDDVHTTFQEPDLAAQSRESMEGRFEGIGAYLRVDQGMILIDRPIRGSPAAAAGLQPGDQIVAVDDAPLADLLAGLADAEASARAAALIRGPAGSVVRLTLRRPPASEPFTVSITRAAVPLITVNAEMLPDGVAYIQITEFKATTTELLDVAIGDLLPLRPRAIVLDLRDNPGGFLTTAQEVLGRFYDGVALYEEERGGVIKELRTIAGPSDRRLFTQPLLVLVNGGSASAAEIVASALRDRRPGTTIMGEVSYGKGSVQNIYQLRDGSSVRITIARWLTPDRAAIDQVGLTPQYLVPPSADAAYPVPCLIGRPPPAADGRCADAQLFWGLRLLRDGTPPPP